MAESWSSEDVQIITPMAGWFCRRSNESTARILLLDQTTTEWISIIRSFVKDQRHLYSLMSLLFFVDSCLSFNFRFKSKRLRSLAGHRPTKSSYLHVCSVYVHSYFVKSMFFLSTKNNLWDIVIVIIMIIIMKYTIVDLCISRLNFVFNFL